MRAAERRARIAPLLGLVGLVACGGGEPGTGPLPPNPPPPEPTPLFTSPIAGTPMETVFYGAYVDHGGVDYNCGFKWYGGHAGVDILLRNFAVQDSGVGVLAAAPGTVIFVHDGEFDRSTQNGSGGLANTVSIEHPGAGAVSYYGHMRSGSIRVTQNATVQRGDTIGLVGSSGNSNWPHLHFEVRRQSGQLADPFLGTCNPPVDQPTWLAQLPWQGDFAVIDAGVTDLQQDFASLLERPADVAVFTPDAQAVVFWANLLNVQATSTRTDLLDPGGALLATAQTAAFTTFSVRFLVATFPRGLLQAAGEYAVALSMTPSGGGGEREVTRRTFSYDPAAARAPGRGPGLRGPTAPATVWLSPQAGDRRQP